MFGEIKIGDFTIKEVDGESLWIVNEDGEGMQTPIVDFEKVVNEYFEDNF